VPNFQSFETNFVLSFFPVKHEKKNSLLTASSSCCTAASSLRCREATAVSLQPFQAASALQGEVSCQGATYKLNTRINIFTN